MVISIKNRLTLGSLFLFALMLFSVVLGLYYLVRLGDEAKEVLANNYDSVRHIHGMYSALDSQEDDAVVAFDSLLNAQEHNITEPGEQAMTAALREHFTAWRDDTSGDAEAPLHIRRDLGQLLGLNLEAIAHKSDLARQNAGHALFWLFLLAVLITLVGLGFSVAFPTVMSAPIVRLKEAVTQLAAHNYRHRIPPFQMKELNELALAFNDMAKELERYENSNLARIMSEKNRAEAVINSLQDASIGVDNEGTVLFANRQALELLALPESQLVGKQAEEIGRQNALFRQVLSDTSQAPFRLDTDGTERYFISALVPITGSKGVLGKVHIVRNITHFQLRDRAKTNFLATISHELKTPLASTDIGLTLLERASDGPLTEEQRAIVSDLRKDHQRLTRIVGELLDLAQAETGNIRVHVNDVPFSAILSNALDAVRSTAHERSVRWEVRTEGAPERVTADADKAVWVLVNLLSNAVRYSPEGGTISIIGIKNEGHLHLTISDQGPGIPPQQRTHLFERFAHGASASPQSTGLGLAIAKEFMEAMGGAIAFDPTVTTGASFILRFPAAH